MMLAGTIWQRELVEFAQRRRALVIKLAFPLVFGIPLVVAARGDAVRLPRSAAAAVLLRGLYRIDRSGAARRLTPPPVQLRTRVTRRRARRPAQPAGLGDTARWLRLPRRCRRTDRPPRSARARVGLSVTMTIASVLAGSYLITQPSIQLPFITNRWAVGIFFLIHIIFGSFTMGALVLGPTYEWIGLRKEDLRYERLARSLGNVNLKVFSLGATLGGFAVIVVVALYGKFFVALLTLFFRPVVVAFSIWFLTLGGILLYNLRWDQFRLRKGLHIAIGYATAATEHIFLFIIVALDSYLLTPGQGQGTAAFFNPSYWPELGHRFVGNISWASFFIAAVAAIYAAASRLPANRLYFHWAARTSLVVGFTTLVLQIALGAIFVESIKQGSPGAFQYSMQGPFAWLWLLQATFIAILLVGSNIYFWQSRPTVPAPVLTGLVVLASLVTVMPAALFPKGLFWVRYLALGIAVLLSLLHWLISRPRVRAATQDLPRSSQVTLAVTGATALLLFLLMGVIRTTARSDYTIYGVMKESDSYGIFQAPSKGYYP